MWPAGKGDEKNENYALPHHISGHEPRRTAAVLHTHSAGRRSSVGAPATPQSRTSSCSGCTRAKHPELPLAARKQRTRAPSIQNQLSKASNATGNEGNIFPIDLCAFL